MITFKQLAEAYCTSARAGFAVYKGMELIGVFEELMIYNAKSSVVLRVIYF